MSWDELLGMAIGGLATGAVVGKWVSLADNNDELRMKIRMDISSFNSGTVEACARLLKSQKDVAAQWSDRAAFIRNYKAEAMLWEEAKLAGIVD